jgi:tRNA (guanine26-N2/guanine27-N2)-dimethyltransferase
MTKENMQRAFRSSFRISKLMSLARDEAEAPLTYYVIDKISNKLSMPVPPVFSILEVLRENGFHAVPTHFNSRGIRTNALASVMQNLLKTALSA